MIDMLGWLAALCTVVCYVPQVIKSWRSRSVGDLLLGMLSLLLLGAILWLAYAVLKGEAPIIVVNLVIIGLSSSLLYLKVIYDP